MSQPEIVTKQGFYRLWKANLTYDHISIGNEVYAKVYESEDNPQREIKTVV